MEALKNKMITRKERIAKFIANASKTGKDRRDEAFLKARLQLLENYWSQFVETFENLFDAATTEALKDDEFFSQDVCSEVECLYIDAKAWLNKELSSFEALTKESSFAYSTTRASVAMTATTPTTIKLPKINLPSFNGSYLDWPSFRDVYLSLIHANPALSAVEKLHYLKAAIVGEAAKLLQHFAITNANYDAAWKIVSERFDNRRVLVNSNLHSLITLPPMSSESPVELRRVMDTFNQSTRALQNLERPVDEWDDWLIYFLSSKLDSTTRKDWETSLSSSTEVPTWSSLQIFLERRLQALCAIKENSTSLNMSRTTLSRNKVDRRSFIKTRSLHLSSTTACVKCKGKHILLFCPQFRSMSAIERLNFLSDHKLCTNCLRADHIATACPSKNRCQQCQKLHHTMIHKATTPITSINASSSSSGTSTTTISHFSGNLRTPGSVLLATAMVVIQSPSGRILKVRALLDQGSESNFITTALAKRLNLPMRRINISVLGIGQRAAGKSSSLASFDIASTFDSSSRYSIQSIVLPRLTQQIPTQSIPLGDWPHIIGLQLADPTFNTASPIDLILGAEVYARILLDEVRRGQEGTPLAQATTLGWILSGHVSTGQNRLRSTLSLHSSTVELNALLRRFWETEEPPAIKQLTPAEEDCEKFFKSTHTRDSQGRYVVQLPFKEDRTLLGSSRAAANASFLRMEKRLDRDPIQRQLYVNFITEYLSLNHMEPVPREEEDTQRCYYLPHHAIVKPTSTTTKLRVVFNASQKTTTGVSLNDILHSGPKLQNDVFCVLMKWRLFPYVFTGDVEKMFRQIVVDSADTDYQRILWRFTPSEPLASYRLLTVTYGTACAPYLACKVLHQIAEDYKHQYPAAAKILKEHFYVDDALFGAFDVKTTRELRNELQALLQKGGLRLRKWLANSEELLSDIPLEDREQLTAIKFLNDDQTKALGIGWNPLRDVLHFHVNIPTAGALTKRNVLADISRLYDPLGWLSPVTITAKIFLQRLWLTKLEWDDLLPPDLTETWLKFKNELNHLRQLEINRWIGTTRVGSGLELHGFCDASLAAYGAAVYLRVIHDPANIQTTLIAAKTRVSPLKTVSLPRLELCGAALLSELMAYVQLNLNFNDVPVHLWSDSMIVLAWLREHPSKWKVYIANRVGLIHDKVPNATWHHISSTDNPADCITRGIPASELPTFTLWWQGPKWLQFSSNFWPSNAPLPVTDTLLEEEVRSAYTSVTTADNSDFELLRRYSSLQRLLRITAYCLRFIRNTQNKSTTKLLGPLKPAELHAALALWIRQVQGSSFSTEFKKLSKGLDLPTNSKLLNFSPFLDDNSLLRLSGRLENSSLSYDEKHPIILPNDSPLSHLIIAHSHLASLHGGVQATLQHTRMKYWILHGRKKVRLFVRNCVTCCRHRAATRTQLMGQLPAERVRPSKPFAHSGVDYAGPFFVKLIKGRGQRTVKSYVAVFICLSTRAVHLELVMDLTSEAFIAAFRRFISRRGRCSKLYSDNARTFVGTDRELKQHLRQLMEQSTNQQFYANEGTEWVFIPPVSPHFGGIWEAGVKAFKHHLRRIIGSHTLVLEEMHTLLAQIEACLNSRPLHAMSDDPSDLSVMTPGHFLVGENLFSVPTLSTLDTSVNKLNRWQMVQNIYEQLWRRWSKEYIHHLQLRYKWQRKQESVRINDLVLIKEDNLPPSKWLLGRIINVHPGADGHVRVVTIRYKDGTFKRAVTKVCVLPVNTTSEHQPHY